MKTARQMVDPSNRRARQAEDITAQKSLARRRIHSNYIGDSVTNILATYRGASVKQHVIRAAAFDLGVYDRDGGVN